MSLPERDREKTLEARQVQSDCPAAPDLPPTQRQTEEAAAEFAQTMLERAITPWSMAYRAFLAGAAWRARQ